MYEVRFDVRTGEPAAIGEIDVVEHTFGDGDTILVQKELYQLMKDNYRFENMVAELFDHVSEEGWTGVGVITNPDGSAFHAGVTTVAYGRHTVGNDHMCEVARLAANGQEIEQILTQADQRDTRHEEGKERERWFEGTEDVYLYDLGAVAISAEVLSIERSLSDYPILNEEAESEIMDDMWQEAFSNSLPSVDDSIDLEELEQEFRGEIDTLCPECGWETSVEEYLEDSDEYEECFDCGEWFAVDADGTETKPNPLCPDCGEDFRDLREEVQEKCEEAYGFNPANGDGLVIRWANGLYYRWDRTRSEWVLQLRQRDQYVINE